MEKMCPYDNKGYGGSRLRGNRAVEVSDEHWEQKRTRVKCPECGRKMWGWAMTGHDGDLYYYAVPPHKRKGWWRRKKKVARDAGTSRSVTR